MFCRLTTTRCSDVAPYSCRHDAVGRLSRKRPAEAIDKRMCTTQVMLQLHDFSIICNTCTLRSHNSKTYRRRISLYYKYENKLQFISVSRSRRLLQQLLSNFSHDGSYVIMLFLSTNSNNISTSTCDRGYINAV